MSKEKEGQIFKRIAALNSDHGPVLGRLVRCLGFLVLYILWCTEHIVWTRDKMIMYSRREHRDHSGHAVEPRDESEYVVQAREMRFYIYSGRPKYL